MSCSLLTSPRKQVAFNVPSNFSGSTAKRSAVRATKLRGLCGTTLLASVPIVVSYHGSFGPVPAVHTRGVSLVPHAVSEFALDALNFPQFFCGLLLVCHTSRSST